MSGFQIENIVSVSIHFNYDIVAHYDVDQEELD